MSIAVKLLRQMKPAEREAYLALLTPGELSEVLSQLDGATAARPAVADFENDLLGWVETFVPWLELTPYQAEALGALTDPDGHRRVAMYGPRGLGKTLSEALVLLWFVTVQEALGNSFSAFVTSGSWFQIHEAFWPAVRSIANRLDFEQMGLPRWTNQELQRSRIQLTHGSASSASPNSAERVEGIHSHRVLAICDEAKMVENSVWDSVQGVFSGDGNPAGDLAWAFTASTPGAPVGWFYKLCTQPNETWHVQRVTIDQAVAGGHVEQKWVDARRDDWGEDSPAYQQHVLGRFIAADQSSIVDISMIEAANDRWREQKAAYASQPITSLGVDLAEKVDRSVICYLRGGAFIEPFEILPHQDLLASKKDIANRLREHPGATAIIDADGLGAFVPLQLQDEGFNVHGFSGNANPGEWRDRGGLQAVNTRSAAYFALRELLDRPDSKLCLPPDDELTAELLATRFAYDTKGRIVVERKELIKKRIGGRSPDRADALAYCLTRSDSFTPKIVEWVPTEQWVAQANQLNWSSARDIIDGPGFTRQHNKPPTWIGEAYEYNDGPIRTDTNPRHPQPGTQPVATTRAVELHHKVIGPNDRLDAVPRGGAWQWDSITGETKWVEGSDQNSDN